MGREPVLPGAEGGLLSPSRPPLPCSLRGVEQARGLRRLASWARGGPLEARPRLCPQQSWREAPVGWQAGFPACWGSGGASHSDPG